MIRIICSHCQKQYRIDPRFIGRSARCGKCHREFPVTADCEADKKLRIGSQFIGRYEILDKIGRGGMGTVYKAYDPILERIVAIKTPFVGVEKPELLERFLREVKIIARLKHPYIVNIYDAGQEKGRYYYAMDFIEGRPLHEVIVESPFSAEEATTLMIEVAEAVHYAHRQGVIHRDLKPANIIVDKNGDPKIIDFGLAKLLKGKADEEGLMGSIPYMSPEQVQHRILSVDERTDIYALGVIFYEMLTGRLPFSSQSMLQILYSIVNCDPPPVRELNPEVPPCLENICLKAMGKKMEARYSSALELAQALRAAGAKNPPVGREMERRQITAVFCDISAPTGTGDAEQRYETVRQYHEICAGAIKDQGGYVAQYREDGVLAYFGYPAAHEDDARRAALAALEIQGKSSLKKILSRAGIHTDLMVVGTGSDETVLALGQTPNVAEKLAKTAAMGAVWISSTTCYMLRDSFVVRQVDFLLLRDATEPLEGYAVLGVDDSPERAEGLSGLLGREEELATGLRLWNQARAGISQLLLIEGDAGIGKSRLVRSLKENLAGKATCLDCHCSPNHQDTPLYPLIEILTRLFDIDREAPSQKLGALEKKIAPHCSSEEVLPFLAPLLSVPVPDAWPKLSPECQRQKIEELALFALYQLSRSTPILLVLEDAHWCDPSTIELLGRIAEKLDRMSALVVVTFRPEFKALWKASHANFIRLGKLHCRHIHDLVVKIAGRELPAELLREIEVKSDGVPLWIEELTRMALELGWRKETPLTFPSSIQAYLTTRLSRMGEERELAQIAAAVGRKCHYRLLCALWPSGEKSLQKQLSCLVQIQVLERQGDIPDATYAFKHSLVRDAVYQSSLKVKRTEYHRRIAEALESDFPEMCEKSPELLAFHFTEAGVVAKALDYRQKAAAKAISTSSCEEAIGHLTQAVELLDVFDPANIRRKLALQSLLGTVLLSSRGYASDQVEHLYSRMWALCQKSGTTAQYPSVIWGLWAYYLTRSRLEIAEKLSEKLLSMAQTDGDADMAEEGRIMTGITSFWQAKLNRAHDQLQIVEAILKRRTFQAFPDGQHPGGVGSGACSWCLWLQGYPDQALRLSQECLRVARTIAHPFNLAFVLNSCVWLHQFRGEARVVQRYAEELSLLSTEQHFTLWAAMADILHGWALAAQNRPAQGLGEISRGMENYRATGAALGYPYYLALLAEAFWKNGETGQALSTLDVALAAIEKSGESWWKPAIHSLQGELLSVGNQEEARIYFQKALDLARAENAKSLELRAAVGLARLPGQPGEKNAGMRLLQDVYRCFTEGYATLDFKQARSLLDAVDESR